MKWKIFFILLLVVFLLPFAFSEAANSLAEKQVGKILLQVESHGEAWYVNPQNLERYFLGRPNDAFNLMRNLGVGISNQDIFKIPFAEISMNGSDNDNDGLSNYVEESFGTDLNDSDTDDDGFNDLQEVINGYSPLIKFGSKVIDLDFAKKQAGKILLQVEKNGEAWYVNPANFKRYFLGRPADAFNVMRGLGLGISNIDLEKITKNITIEQPSVQEAPNEILISPVLPTIEDVNEEEEEVALEPTIEDVNEEEEEVALEPTIPECWDGSMECGYGYECVDQMCVQVDNLISGMVSEEERGSINDEFEINWNEFNLLHPEEVGINHSLPGVYDFEIGDGFIYGIYLVKIVDFRDYVADLIVFRKESNGEYYYYPSSTYSITKEFYSDIHGLSLRLIETEGNYQIDYSLNCAENFTYCDQNNISDDYCNWRCEFDARPGHHILKNNGIFYSRYPIGYPEVAEFALDALSQCYGHTEEFLGYENNLSRVVFDIGLTDSWMSSMTGKLESISGKASYGRLDYEADRISLYREQLATNRCVNYRSLSHELAHTMTKGMFDNYGLNEGFADFVSLNNTGNIDILCFDNGWRYITDDLIQPYISLSGHPSSGLYASDKFYSTGFCFWSQYVEKYGYSNFVSFLRELKTKARGAEEFYIMDVMAQINGESFDYELRNKFGLTREATYVDSCPYCGLFE